MRRLRTLLCLLALLGGAALLSPAAPAGSAPAAATVQGTIASIDAHGLALATATGRSRVETTAGTGVFDRLPARLQDIRVGDFIGVAARTEPDGALTAVSINILSAIKGQAREGQFPMENGNIMTNAVVTQYVSRVAGRTVTLVYARGTASIRVPPGTEIHRLALGSLRELTTGMRVTVRGTGRGGGTLAASSITIEHPGP